MDLTSKRMYKKFKEGRFNDQVSHNQRHMDGLWLELEKRGELSLTWESKIKMQKLFNESFKEKETYFQGNLNKITQSLRWP